MHGRQVERIRVSRHSGASRQKGSERLTATLLTSHLKPSTRQEFKFSSVLKTFVNRCLRNYGSADLVFNIRNFISNEEKESLWKFRSLIVELSMPAPAGKVWRMTISHTSNCKRLPASVNIIEWHLFAFSFIRLRNSFLCSMDHARRAAARARMGSPLGIIRARGVARRRLGIGNGGIVQ